MPEYNCEVVAEFNSPLQGEPLEGTRTRIIANDKLSALPAYVKWLGRNGKYPRVSFGVRIWLDGEDPETVRPDEFLRPR